MSPAAGTPPPPPDPRPLSSPAAAVEALLRQPHRVAQHFQHANTSASLLGVLLCATLVAALAYGVVMGSFSGGTQWWAAPLKVAGGLVVAALICLPSLFIFVALSGSEARLREVVGLVAGLLALMTILLVGFAPVAWVFSQSTESVVAMGILHLLFWGTALVFALRFLDRHLGGRGGERTGVRVWMVIFVLVMVQMTTSLRPLLGAGETFLPKEKRFFLEHWSECIRDQAQAVSR